MQPPQLYELADLVPLFGSIDTGHCMLHAVEPRNVDTFASWPDTITVKPICQPISVGPMQPTVYSLDPGRRDKVLLQ